jgi:hypothetical protein
LAAVSGIFVAREYALDVLCGATLLKAIADSQNLVRMCCLI